MKKYQYETERNNETDGEITHTEENKANSTLIGKLVLHQSLVHKPSQHDTRQEGTCRQHQLGCEEIAELHQRHSKELQAIISTNGERAEHRQQATNGRQYPSGTLS
jgi:hypothetical protein